MIADFAIHNKGDGNPHAHILLSMRAMDENGKWLPKAHKVYDLDENGERIRLPSGEWKSHKENTVDWNDRRNAEIWRSEWANTVNRYFEKNGIPQRLDLRSFARQGKTELPTVHLGPAVVHMEQKGIATEIGDYNRQIKSHNAKLRELRRLVVSLKAWLTEVSDKLMALFEKEPEQPSLLDIVNTYFDMRKDARYDWSRYAKQKGGVIDLKHRVRIFNWMQETGIKTLEDFKALVDAQQPVINQIKTNEKAIAKLEKGVRIVDALERLQPIYDKSKRGFKSSREKFVEAHKDELADYFKAMRYLKANGISTDDRQKLLSKAKTFQAENEKLRAQLVAANIDPEMIRQIRYCVDTVLRESDIPEKKGSVLEKLNAYKTTDKPKQKKHEDLSL